MINCPTDPRLCQSTKTESNGVHHCYKDPDHTGSHVCACWHRWPNEATKP